MSESCPACKRPFGKWDRIFQRLEAGETVVVPNANAAKNAHHMAEKRGLRVTTSKADEGSLHLVKLIGKAVA